MTTAEQIDMFNPDPVRAWWTCPQCKGDRTAVVIEACWRGPRFRHDLYGCPCGWVSQATRPLVEP